MLLRKPVNAGLLGAGALIVILAGSAMPVAQQKQQHPIASVDGADMFRAHCAVCHGTNATGNGPASSALKVKPPDLTTIAKRNGNKFPRELIRGVIAGNDEMTAHGSREMPIWGPIFHEIAWDQDLGHVRLENLTKYLESIQKK
jgi:mono/diheme cytochrome c family protein